MSTEEVIVSNFNFEKNDNGMYPSMDNAVFMCSDGGVYSIVLGQDDIGKYSYLGVSVGDDIDSAKEKLSNFYTFLETSPDATKSNTMNDYFKDNQYGNLMINYDMKTKKINTICYVVEVEGSLEDEGNQKNDSEQEVLTYEDLVDNTLSLYGDSSGYAICDIDDDGINELIVSYGTCNADWENEVFTLIDGNAVYLGVFYGAANLYYSDQYITGNGQGIIAVTGNAGNENIDQIKKIDNEFYVDNISIRQLSDDEGYYGNEMPIGLYSVTDKSGLN